MACSYRFGRYPPRNSSLGRVNTLEEEEYLKRRAQAIAQTDGTKHHTGTMVHPDNVLFDSVNPLPHVTGGSIQRQLCNHSTGLNKD